MGAFEATNQWYAIAKVAGIKLAKRTVAIWV
jgi:hypothetical protein